MHVFAEAGILVPQDFEGDSFSVAQASSAID